MSKPYRPSGPRLRVIAPIQTIIVSSPKGNFSILEAIFLSTFVMISQNRADEKRQVLADQQWQMVQEEDQQNVQLLTISRQILDLTKAIHGKTVETPKTHSDAGEG